MAVEKIKIRLEAYDHEILDESVRKIVDSVRKSGATISGPIPLPTRIERYTVLRSPHIDKKSREQFEIRTFKRLIYISNFNTKTQESLNKLDIPAGVEVQIRVEKS
ncbi:MAG: 30S ribosomal protein S10 [Planctomycetes bacterium]|nr:30S ribosomal protein S10 [Planctomycetota bacterium]